MPKIEVLDAIMGSGKTEGIIRWMNSRPSERFLYVSPMLSEVEVRIPQACPSLAFQTPSASGYGTKAKHLLDLLVRGKNVAFTHALYTDLSGEHLEVIKQQGYILVIDEEIGFIEPYNGPFVDGDVALLNNHGFIQVDKAALGKVIWTDSLNSDHKENSLTEISRLAKSGVLYATTSCSNMLVVQLPIELITAAKRVIVLTYMFKDSVMSCFMKLHKVDVVTFTEVTGLLSERSILDRASKLVNFKRTTSITRLKSDTKATLTSTWYSKGATNVGLAKVTSAIRSVFRASDSTDILLTLPKGNNDRFTLGEPNKRCVIHPNVNTEGVFLYCRARATNEYAHKSVAVHAFNRYLPLPVKTYLQDYGTAIGATPKDDEFALSEMVQWLWRTRIRKGEPINVYIVSTRMERLLKKWLEGGFIY